MVARSIFAKPFPVDATLESLTSFFGQQGVVQSVRMRRWPASKDFNGTVFVEFDTEETAQKVLASELEFAGAPITMQARKDYEAATKGQ